MTERRALAFACAALAVAWVLYAALAIKDFSGPLVGPKDTNYFEYLGYHLLAHYKYGLPPDLGFQTDDVGYYQGTSIAYLSWCAERDLLCMLSLKAFGAGPWIQIYCAASPGIGAFGTLFLLRRDFGVARAALCAFAGSFMAFYAFYKFPYHLNMAALHWGTVSIVCDFLITRRIVRTQPIEAWLLLVRAALMLLVVGLDLGYVAGYPLTVFTVSLVFWVCYWAATARRRGISWRAYFPRAPLADLKRTPLVTALSLAGIAVGGLVYVPFAFAVVKGASIYKFTDAGGNFWAQWLRMLIPFLPGVSPSSPWVRAIFGEAEGLGEYSVGWCLIAFAALGVRSARKKRELTLLAPLLVSFVLCFAFHPRRFPTLHLFPWFFFNRVAGRATIFFPIMLALMALHAEAAAVKASVAAADKPRLKGRIKPVIYILLGLGALESVTAYTRVNDYAPAHLAPDAGAYFNTVKRAKGEALLEFPFCMAGANAAQTRVELCPYWGKMAAAYAYRRFHQKKVMSFYLSRMHASQVTPERAELASLFLPDTPDAHDAAVQTRCWNDAEWSLFERTYHAHDFAGIQIYTERLPPACVLQFHARYGEPTATTVLPGPGRVEFFPRARE